VRDANRERHHVFGMDLLREHDDDAADDLVDFGFGGARRALGCGRRRVEHPIERRRDRNEHGERENDACGARRGVGHGRERFAIT
jgi:hypothetical protein